MRVSVWSSDVCSYDLRVAEVVAQVELDIDTAVALPRDIDELVEDHVDIIRRVILSASEQIAQRLVREILRIIAAEQDIRRAELGDLALHLDVEIIDREVDRRSRKSTRLNSSH